MIYLAIKATLSGIIVMIVSEAARRNPGIGGLIASLPLVSILAILWLWRDASDVERSPPLHRQLFGSRRHRYQCSSRFRRCSDKAWDFGWLWRSHAF